MTAQLLEYTSASDLRVRRVRAARAASAHVTVAPHRDAARIQASWGSTQVRACDVERPAALVPVGAPAAPATRLVWTDRGIAVMLALVVIVTGVMVTTLVNAFLAVSNAPVVALVGG